jgi:uncharacterized protein (DUF58 family)
MPSARGVLVFAAGLSVWLAARITGSSTLHMVAVGLVALPFAAALFARWSRQRVLVSRRLSDPRVRPGGRVTVELDVENHGLTSTSFLLLEDRLPPALGRRARLAMSGLPARGSQRVSYTLVPRARGRYVLGPLLLDISDPFALTRLRIEFDERDELLVTPVVENLSGDEGSQHGRGSGSSRARQLMRTGEEFYTMRPYQEGDDLRRIHWPSVARSGELMIRQDESSRRASALLFLDNRESALGETHSPPFEKAVSVAASVGVLLSRSGFGLRLATAQSHPAPMSEERFLEALASVSHHTARSMSGVLSRIRSAASADTTLVVITAPPVPGELNSLIRAGTAFGPRMALLIYPIDPERLPPDRRSQLEGRATVARQSLSRAGWDVLVLPPSANLRDIWLTSRTKQRAFTG